MRKILENSVYALKCEEMTKCGKLEVTLVIEPLLTHMHKQFIISMCDCTVILASQSDILHRDEYEALLWGKVYSGKSINKTVSSVK